MKLVSYLKDGQDQLAFYVNGFLYDTDALHPELPSSMNMFLNFWEDNFPIAQAINKSIQEGKIGIANAISTEDVQLICPLPFPNSCRDGYAFRQHVEASRRNRNAPVVPEFDQFPVFYFTNHHSIQGPGEVKCMPDHLQKLDFELEAAIVICKSGRNIRAADADEYIGGLMIMNDFSARLLQSEEMKLNLGPAKGKDFATALGPWLVTTDELVDYEVPAKEGHVGKNWSLGMKCCVNGTQVSEGNLSDMNWTFAEIIERCSYGATLSAGDIIGSGTVGTGCFFELNGTGKLGNPAYEEQWLQLGDVIELEIDGLGILQNTIVEEDDDFSLLANKKNI
jgi:fumarylacetoacetate (FAA) hydrolase